MFIFITGPIAFVGYCLLLRYLFRSNRYRWAFWLWAVTFVVQLPFFYKWDWAGLLLCYMFDPFTTWASEWHDKPVAALLLLVVPSGPAFLAWRMQFRRYIGPPAPPPPPRPWVVPALVATYLVFLLALVW